MDALDSNLQMASVPATCPTCHRPVEPTFYFCPNCGTSLKPAPLPTTPLAQTLVYAHSVALPMLLFITIGQWRGHRYYKSADDTEHAIGVVAWTLLILSTVLSIWLAWVGTQMAIQSSVAQINADMSI